MILCGGAGTRLGRLTERTPKPLLPVAGRPFLDTLLFELGRQGIQRIVLLAAFEAGQFRDYCRDHELASRFGLQLDLSIEPERAGTGGALFHAQALADDEFLLMNGDSWFDLNLLSLIRRAEQDRGAAAVLALRHVGDSSRYGVATLERGRVTSFGERARHPRPGLVNGGVYFMRRSAFQYLLPKSSFEGQILPAMVADDAVGGVVENGYFLDIGVPDAYDRAQREIPAQRHRPAVFLNLDGIFGHGEGILSPLDRFRWTDRVKAGIKAFNDAGLYVFALADRAGMAQGFPSDQADSALYRVINDELRPAGAHVDDVRTYPRYPKPALRRQERPDEEVIEELLDLWPVNAGRSHWINDMPSHMEAAFRAELDGPLFASSDLFQFAQRAAPDRHIQ